MGRPHLSTCSAQPNERNLSIAGPCARRTKFYPIAVATGPSARRLESGPSRNDRACPSRLGPGKSGRLFFIGRVRRAAPARGTCLLPVNYVENKPCFALHIAFLTNRCVEDLPRGARAPYGLSPLRAGPSRNSPPILPPGAPWWTSWLAATWVGRHSSQN